MRESWHEGSRIHKKTLANISHWPHFQVDSLRRVLKGEHLVRIDELLVVERSLPHGHVEAVLGTLRKLGMERLLDSRQSRERTLVVAMIVEQVLHSCSKLAQTRLWETTSLGEELGVLGADENDLYRALDWLLERQGRIEARLAKRHLQEGSFVFYDVTSSYYEGHTCPLARLGYARDGKMGLPVIVYGTLADVEGRPVAVRQYKNLSKVERIYRTLKGMDIRVRPIRHRTEAHVRAHIFLCLLAYYVEWHMRQDLSPILFHDEELEAMARRRDPVAKAQASESAQRKKRTLHTPEGLPVHSLESLLEVLGKRSRYVCRLREGNPDNTLVRYTEVEPLQRRAFDLLGLPYPVTARQDLS